MSGTPGGSNLPPQQHNQGPNEENVASGKAALDMAVAEPNLIASGSAPFYSQYSNVQPAATGQQRQVPGWIAPTGPGSPQYGLVHGQDPALQSFNMGALAGALPDHSAIQTGQHQHQHPNLQHQFSSQRSPLMPPNPSLGYQFQQNPQFPTQISGQNPQTGPQPLHTNLHYSPTFISGPNMTPGMYGQYGVSPTRATAMGQAPQHVPSFPQPSQYFYGPMPPTTYAPGQQMVHGFQQSNRRSSFPGQGMAAPFSPDGVSTASLSGPFGPGSPYGSVIPQRTRNQNQDVPKQQSSEANLGSIPRGPPRKPKQSGHALWVGNLPPGTTVMDLKDHFSREATKDIESLFLISKSNCAFVNYRTENACAAAMQRFHDSRLHGVRLVCRLRRSSAPTNAAPVDSAPRGSSTSPQRSAAAQTSSKDAQDPQQQEEEVPNAEVPETSKLSERYFIVKSLTLQDLELSVKNGIWATQSHNEESLNKAYEASENVYLIFSANKSGEYFGYARMTSPISDDASEIMKSIPKPDTQAEASDAPKSIPTAATEWAPKGRIIDDSARGTIFWEAEVTDEEDESAAPATTSTRPSGAAEDLQETDSEQIWGKPFKIEWISTNRLPFYRTRGLRNPWNANREVKIARDGTELETNVGKRLVQMFHRLGPSTNAGGASAGYPPAGAGASGNSGAPVWN